MHRQTAKLGKPDRRARVHDIAAALPETEIGEDQHVAFRIRRKVFAYYLDNHHDDGLVVVCGKSTLPHQRELVKQHPDRYCVPAYVGPRGWVSLRIDLPLVDWDEVEELLRSAYRLTAPPRLAELI
jgi:hypothetical protein